MINSEINFQEYANLLKNDGRVQIPNYLEPSLAENLYQCLKHDVNWDLAYRIESDILIPSDDLVNFQARELSLIKEQLNQINPQEYSYMYHTYMMITAYIEQRNPGLLLDRFLEMLNSPNYVSFLRQLTGQSNIVKINAQATKYIKDDFLRPHNDFNENEGREFAYVINLTKDWESEFGGQLCFLDSEQKIEEKYLPTFNSLSLFKVPKMHQVSKVVKTDKPRLAITGWLLNK
ncbi:2OG-Fe(II) oxygenase family protein [Kangiella sp. HZ709]|uniref:2OG-Fe(II) oxygenase n=1 Tax=Kangiella sp. HZ709 TaxID=2666328 RepID=UPI0012B0AB41|nr:2OG-Fe(II) oxygenase family protein [Kangiella sp. HZ709]MRX27726.1 hypothetical protein [Kangiella sp. HZ709]